MPITATVTALLLTVGAVLALFGVAGFLGNWSCRPDHDSLRYAQVLAVTGRRLSYSGLALYVANYSAAGPALVALLLVATLALCTYLTRTSNTIVPSGVPS